MFNNNGVPTLFFSQMTSSDGSGQVWGALQTFGYQLISGGGELMNAACLHHRHRRHSLLPTTAFLSRHCTLRPRSLPFLLPLPALPSLCLAPTPLTHTSSLPVSQPLDSPLFTTTNLSSLSLSLQGAGAISKTMVAPIERIKVVLQVERGSGRAATAIGREILRDQVRQTGEVESKGQGNRLN